MKGETVELERESFWKEHRNTLIQLRDHLSSGGTSRAKSNKAGLHKNVAGKGTTKGHKLKHPPYGKYRRTPSPFLPKLNVPNIKKQKLSPRKYEVVPPVKPKLAFTKPAPLQDYDSWGEESDIDTDDYADDSSDTANSHKHVSPHKQTKHSPRRKRYKPQPYPPAPTRTPPGVVYGAPFPVYYPPPPIHSKAMQKKPETHRSHSKHYKVSPTLNKFFRPSKKKDLSSHHLLPVKTSYPKVPAAVPVMYSPVSQEDEQEEEDEEIDEYIKEAFHHWKKHPLFCNDFTDWLVQDFLHTELLPDFLIDIFNEMKYMPYSPRLHVPSIYSCEDIIAEQTFDMITDIVRETITDFANDYLDERRLQVDPVDDFIDGTIEDVVVSGIREVVRSSILELAEDYMTKQTATQVVCDLVDDLLHSIAGDLFEDVLFDMSAEAFISSEVIEPEVKDEAEVIARETLQYYDDKVMKREFKEVKQMAEVKLADAVMMELILSVISQQRKMWTEDDHYSRFIDELIFNESMTQVFSMIRERDKTLLCKPLHKLHEKAVSDVALDVFLQQLTRTLDEDLADVDEYERHITDTSVYHFPFVKR